MAGLALQDVLDATLAAVAKVEKGQGELTRQIESVRIELIAKMAVERREITGELSAHIQAVSNGLRTVEAKVDAVRSDVAFRGLENDVDTLKKDVAALKAARKTAPARPAARRR